MILTVLYYTILDYNNLIFWTQRSNLNLPEPHSHIVLIDFSMRQHLNKSKIHRQTNSQTHKQTLSFVCLCMPLYDFV